MTNHKNERELRLESFECTFPITGKRHMRIAAQSGGEENRKSDQKGQSRSDPLNLNGRRPGGVTTWTAVSKLETGLEHSLTPVESAQLSQSIGRSR